MRHSQKLVLLLYIRFCAHLAAMSCRLVQQIYTSVTLFDATGPINKIPHLLLMGCAHSQRDYRREREGARILIVAWHNGEKRGRLNVQRNFNFLCTLLTEDAPSSCRSSRSTDFASTECKTSNLVQLEFELVVWSHACVYTLFEHIPRLRGLSSPHVPLGKTSHYPPTRR